MYFIFCFLSYVNIFYWYAWVLFALILTLLIWFYNISYLKWKTPLNKKNSTTKLTGEIVKNATNIAVGNVSIQKKARNHVSVSFLCLKGEQILMKSAVKHVVAKAVLLKILLQEDKIQNIIRENNQMINHTAAKNVSRWGKINLVFVNYLKIKEKAGSLVMAVKTVIVWAVIPEKYHQVPLQVKAGDQAQVLV